MLKIIVHDYAGHPFPLTLSEELSKKNKVYHLYFKNDYGPKASFKSEINENLKVESIGLNIKYNKSNFFTRFIKDFIYGHHVAKRIDKIKPDVIISGQCPTFAQEIIINSSKKNNSKFIIWVQDFYSPAVRSILMKKLSFLSLPISLLFRYFEKKQFKIADHLIIISDNFLNQLNKWKINNNKISIIQNWGNLDQIKFNKDKDFTFLKENNLDVNKFYILYTGTLALKHNPYLILEIANCNPNIEIVVVGIGSGYQKLKINKNLPKNIKLLPLQSFDKMNNVLNSADIFLAMLNSDAGDYSVPSKILNYLCAGKPIVFSGPKNNLAAKIIESAGAGSVFDPDNFHDLNKYINKLEKDNETRDLLSKNARNYAEKNFEIKYINKKFEKIINKVIEK
jgi:colanic acid biosynthesis glycosyl transferase WcaI